MRILMYKISREFFDAREAEGYITTVVRNVSCTEQVIPESQREAKIDAIAAFLWQMVRMMPDVHLRAIEEVGHNGPQQQRTGTD